MKMIWADSSHSTTQYYFLLTSLLVLDDFGEAIAGPWNICNGEDAEALAVFMSALKELICIKTILPSYSKTI